MGRGDNKFLFGNGFLTGVGNVSLFDTREEYIRRDGITDFIFKQAKELYGDRVTKEDIFYYTYGFLHLPSYRKTFAADLKKSLPRLMLVDEPKIFWALAKAGRELAKLHLHYEAQAPPEEVIIEGEASGDYKVTKLRWASKDNKNELVYNDSIRIKNIPSEAQEYVINGRTPLEWIIDRYQWKEDAASGIVNDPNKWGEEHGDERYILRLLLSAITVSVKTAQIVRALPEVAWE